MIEIIINDEWVDLSPDTVVALTRQANDVGDIQNRQSDFTNTFSLPKTQKNLRIFDYINNIHSENGFPYTQPTCKILVEGIEIVSSGIVNVDNVGETIDITILTGNGNFFNIIKDKSIRELDMSSYDLVWTRTNIIIQQENTEGSLWPIMDWGSLDETNNAQFLYYRRWLDVRDLRPAIYLFNVVNEIILQAGFSPTMFSSLDDPSRYAIYEKLVLAFVSIRPDSAVLDKLKVKGYMYEDSAVKFSGSLVTYLLPLGESSHAISYDPYNLFYNFTGVAYRLDVKASGTYTIEVSINMYIDAQHDAFEIQVIDRWWTKVHIETVAAGGAAHYVQKNFTITKYMSAGDGFIIRMEHPIGTYTYTVTFNGTDAGYEDPYDPSYSCELKVTKAENLNHVGYGWDIPCANNLPDISQVELLKFVAQMFCGIYITNPVTKEVDLIPFNEISRNKKSAYDWSDKLSLGNHYSMKFSFKNYAQKNWLKYTPLEDDTTGYGDGYFEIPDESLPAEKTVLETPFSPTKMKKFMDLRNSCYIPNIVTNSGHRIFTYDDNGTYWSDDGVNFTLFSAADHNHKYCWFWGADNTNYDGDGARIDQGVQLTDEIAPRIFVMDIDNASDSIFYFVGDTDDPFGDNADIGFCYFIHDTLESIDFQSLIDKYYPDFVSMLTNCKVLKVPFKLSANEVSSFDFSRPVWIKYFSSYFYVNKISEFISGQLTEVELLKLK